MAHDVHIIGGGLAGSEAAWQLARRGVARAAVGNARRRRSTPAHQSDGLAELVCSNSFRSDDDEKNAVGLLHHEMRAARLAGHARGRSAQVPAGSAMAVDRDVFSAEVERELPALPNSRDRARADRYAARGGPDHRRHRPADRRLARRQHRPRDRRRQPGLLRCDRADRPPREHRHGRVLDGRALGQGRQGLHQLPDGPSEQYHAFVAGPARRREERVQGVGGEHALLRRLHADRGHGRARASRRCASDR